MEIRYVDAGEVSYLRSQTLYHALGYTKKPKDRDTIILDIPKDPYVCIGFHQDVEQEIDLKYCRSQNIPVLRRETGGGAVYLDKNQLFTQWIFDSSRLPKRIDARFKMFVNPLIETYKYFGVNAFYYPPNDVHVGNKKIVGTGAATIGNAEVVTGNFLLDFDSKRMAQILTVPDEEFREEVYKSLDKYMTSFKRELSILPDIKEIKKVYIKECEKVLGQKIVKSNFSDVELKMAEELDKRFSTKEWLYYYENKKPKSRKLKIHAGVYMYEIFGTTENGIIRLQVRTKGNLIDQVSIKNEIDISTSHRLRGMENVLRRVEISETALTEVLEAFYELHNVKTPGIEIKNWVDTLMQVSNL